MRTEMSENTDTPNAEPEIEGHAGKYKRGRGAS